MKPVSVSTIKNADGTLSYRCRAQIPKHMAEAGVSQSGLSVIIREAENISSTCDLIEKRRQRLVCHFNAPQETLTGRLCRLCAVDAWGIAKPVRGFSCRYGG